MLDPREEKQAEVSEPGDRWESSYQGNVSMIPCGKVESILRSDVKVGWKKMRCSRKKVCDIGRKEVN